MTEEVKIGVPDSFPDPDAFEDRLSQRFSELTADLALDPKPDLSWAYETTGLTLSINGQTVALELPKAGTTSTLSDSTADADAERVARSLFRHRWKLLASALGTRKIPSRPVLKDVAQGGFTLPQLIELHKAEPTDDVNLAFLAAERHPPSVTLLLPREEVDDTEGDSWLREAAQTLAAYYGIPVPVPAVAPDLWLDSGQYRLRVGSVRSGVQPERWDGPTRANQLQRVLRRHAPELFDVGSLLTLISDPARVPTDVTRAALAKVTLLEMTWALRDLLKAGIGLVDPLQICEAVTQSTVELESLGQNVLALPGVLVIPETPNLVLQLRARLVPAHLRRWIIAEGLAQEAPRAISFGKATFERLRKRDMPPEWATRLAKAIATEIAGSHDLLLVPADLGKLVRELLTDLLPDLLVVNPQDLPPDRKPVLRSVIEIGA